MTEAAHEVADASNVGSASFGPAGSSFEFMELIWIYTGSKLDLGWVGDTLSPTMDPICHTLVGASLAGTRLGDRSWGAKATLIVAANLPDVDVVSLFWGQNASMAWRRGWTHGVLAIAVAPLLLAWLVGWWGRRSGREVRQEVSLRWLVGLSYLGFLSHPVLDWLNTYGMRWLMPFDGTWFYGDAIYIVDPWMWLIPGGAAFLRFSGSRRAVVLWTVLAALLSAPIFVFETSISTRLLWTAVLVALAVVRWRGTPSPRVAHAACVAALGLVAAYIAVMLALQGHAHSSMVAESGLRSEEVFVGPLPARVEARDVLLVGNHEYTPGTIRVDGERTTRDPLAIESEDTHVLAALLAPCAQGIADWLRYPFFRIEELDEGGSRVHLLDARYVRSATPGFGMWTLEFDADGRIVKCP